MLALAPGPVVSALPARRSICCCRRAASVAARRCQRPGALCAACWRGITFLGAPCCACCGLPFDFDLGADALCGACARSARPSSRARAAMRYDEDSRRLVLAFKHGDRLHLAPTLGAWMRRAGADAAGRGRCGGAGAAALDPALRAPLQPGGGAGACAGQAGGPPVGADWLVRRRRTPSQGQAQRVGAPPQRRRRLRARARGRTVAGKRVLLVDDVFTTGATLDECARVLQRAGAARVDVLTLARTVREDG